MWVKIEKVILKSSERTAKLPEDTKKCDYVMRINGFCENENAKIGDTVKIKTLTGREIEGRLVEINPKYGHDFGEPVEELMHIGKIHRQMLSEGE